MQVNARPEQYVLDQQTGREGLIEYLRVVEDIPGWFEAVDILLFQKIDDLQLQQGVHGDLLEVGMYHGKSAILLEYLRREVSTRRLRSFRDRRRADGHESGPEPGV
jgi:hypothetical protein